MSPKTASRLPLMNRELGILAFNRRVLAQAADESVPLLEWLRFLTIVSSNLDEFFEIRVAGLKEQVRLGISDAGRDGMTPKETLTVVCQAARELSANQYDLLNDELLPELAKAGVRFLRRGTWTEAQRTWVHDYFVGEALPVLTPIGLDPAHPFPRVFNKSLNFIVELEGRDAFGRGSRVAIVQAPRVLPRAIRVPPAIADCEYGFVFLTSVMHAHVDELFAGMTVKGCYQFRVTRNSDLFVDEEEIKNLRIALQGELLHRHFGDAVRLEVVEECTPAMIDYLMQQFSLEEQDLYHVDGPVNLYRLREVLGQIDRPDLKYPPFVPSVPAALELGDVCVQHRGQVDEGVLALGDRRRQADRARQDARRLHDRDARAAAEGVPALELHDQVEALVEHARERVRRVEADRRQHRQHFALEVVVHPGALRVVPGAAPQELDPRLRELRQQHIVQKLELLRDEVARLARDDRERLLRRHPVRPRIGDAELDLLLDAGDADLEELVEVRRDDGQEAQPLEQRHGLVGGLREHAPLESEDAELAI